MSKPICVDGKKYSYDVSFDANTGIILVVRDDKNKRYVIDFSMVVVPERKGVQPTWRGKHSDRCIGKYEVACAIKQLKI